MSTMSVAPRWTKEIRAIAPFVLGVCALGILASLEHTVNVRGLVPVAAVVGAVAIGAFSIGGEYATRTLTWTLAQPESRAALWIRKRVVAVAGVAVVLAAGWLALKAMPPDPTDTLRLLVAEFLVSGLCAVTIAPMLSMAGRSPLFGLVLTVALIMSVWSLGNVLAYTKFGPILATGVSAADWTADFVWWTSVPCCAVGLAIDWVLFSRLQAIDGGSLTLFAGERTTRGAKVLDTRRGRSTVVRARAERIPSASDRAARARVLRRRLAGSRHLGALRLEDVCERLRRV